MNRNRYSLCFPILFVLLLIGGAACRQSQVFQIETLHFEKGLAGCLPKEDNCSFLKLSYPQLSRGFSQGREVLNAAILRFALEQDAGSEAKNPQKAADALFADFQQFKEENPKSFQVWWQIREVEVLANDPKILSLVFSSTQNMGGAHPSEIKTLHSFDPKSGRTYRLSDLLKPGYEQALNAVGETRFRQVRKLPPNVDLNDAGFVFEKGFQLNDNFAAGPEGLVFYYNPYEVASYVDGPTELTIPYPQIKEWLIAGGPLSSLAKL